MTALEIDSPSSSFDAEIGRPQLHVLAAGKRESVKKSNIRTRMCSIGMMSPCEAGKDWVAVKELKLSYYIGETLLFTTYTNYGNLI